MTTTIGGQHWTQVRICVVTRVRWLSMVDEGRRRVGEQFERDPTYQEAVTVDLLAIDEQGAPPSGGDVVQRIVTAATATRVSPTSCLFYLLFYGVDPGVRDSILDSDELARLPVLGDELTIDTDGGNPDPAALAAAMFEAATTGLNELFARPEFSIAFHALLDMGERFRAAQTMAAGPSPNTEPSRPDDTPGVTGPALPVEATPSPHPESVAAPGSRQTWETGDVSIASTPQPEEAEETEGPGRRWVSHLRRAAYGLRQPDDRSVGPRRKQAAASPAVVAGIDALGSVGVMYQRLYLVFPSGRPRARHIRGQARDFVEHLLDELPVVDDRPWAFCTVTSDETTERRFELTRVQPDLRVSEDLFSGYGFSLSDCAEALDTMVARDLAALQRRSCDAAPPHLVFLAAESPLVDSASLSAYSTLARAAASCSWVLFDTQITVPSPRLLEVSTTVVEWHNDLPSELVHDVLCARSVSVERYEEGG